MSYDSSEQDILMAVFTRMLKATTTDGGVKRARGEKPPWWSEAELKPHEAAMFSHLNKWKHGEKVDKDSGVHPLVHLAWRALAIAYQETAGSVDPATPPMYIDHSAERPKGESLEHFRWRDRGFD